MMILLLLVVVFFVMALYFYSKYYQLHNYYNRLLQNNNNRNILEKAFQDEISYQEIVKSLQNQEFLVNFSNYLNSSSGDYTRKVNNALNILGKYLKISRIYIFEDYGNGKMTRNIFEWCASGVVPEKQSRQRISYNLQLSGLKKQLIKDSLIYSGVLSDLPQHLSTIILPSGTKSVLILPLYVYNDFYGFIGFDNCDVAKDYDDLELGFLKSISLILSTAIERRITSHEIIQSESKFKDIFNNSSDAILIYDLYGSIFEINNRSIAFLGYTRNELLNLNITSLFPDIETIRDQLFHADKSLEDKIFDHEIYKSDGLTFPVEVRTQFICFNSKRVILCVIRNIIERKQIEREIFSAIIQTEEKERGRIARDLHDGLGPLLSSLKLYMKVLDTSTELSRREEIFRNTNEVIDESISLLKQISNNLSPQVLNDFGLASAIQSFCKKISFTKTIDIKFDSNVYDQRFEKNTEMVLFRILKELVNNTIRHALAQQIQIFLLRTDKILTLVYGDNGVGFDIKRVLDDRYSGMGISNIVNRIGSIDGKLLFESQSGHGIHVKIEVELK